MPFLRGLVAKKTVHHLRNPWSGQGGRPPPWLHRPDPFEGVWCDVLGWLQEDPDASAVVLLGRLQEAEPDRFTRAHLRTLQRRVQQWRGIMAEKLVYATGGEPMAGLPAMPRSRTGFETSSTASGSTISPRAAFQPTAPAWPSR